MHRGFIINNISFDLDPYHAIGMERFKRQKAAVEENLQAFMYKNNTLDASRIQDNWFPQTKAHAFLSHSHKDADNAIACAGWLYHFFNIDTFIDSAIWGYSDDLLQIIDNEYSRGTDGRFEYQKRNISTSHVHMMLSTALTMMIDKAECLFFMNTPNSIIPAENIQKTISPWIYFEMVTSQTIRKKPPERVFEKELSLFYTLDLNHLEELSKADLDNWSNGRPSRSAEDALDKLYAMKPAKKNPDVLIS
jgi:hypothetical protein